MSKIENSKEIAYREALEKFKNSRIFAKFYSKLMECIKEEKHKGGTSFSYTACIPKGFYEVLSRELVKDGFRVDYQITPLSGILSIYW